MKTKRHTILAGVVLAMFLYGSAGLPLYTHICSLMGTLPLFSECEMEANPLPECCAQHVAETPPGMASISSIECCRDHDNTQVLDTAARPDKSNGDAQCVCLAMTAPIADVFSADAAVRLNAYDDSSPPGRVSLAIRHCSLLI